MTEVDIPVEEEVEVPVEQEVDVPIEIENTTQPKEYTKKEKEQIKKDLLEGKQHDVYELKKLKNGSVRLEKKKQLTTTEKRVKEQTETVNQKMPKQAYMTDTQLLWQNYSDLKSRMDTENTILRQKLKKYKKQFNELFEDDIQEVPEQVQEPIPEPEPIQQLAPLVRRNHTIYRSKFRR
jgi:hypothetical protein